jgi:hypothetical protein
MRAEWVYPEIDIEIAQTISGIVKKGLVSIAAPNIDVSVLSYNDKRTFYKETKTDKSGRFRIDDFELPDSSVISVLVLKSKNKKKGLLEVNTDTIIYPQTGDFGIPLFKAKIADPFMEKKIAETNWMFKYVEGQRLIRLPEIVVRAKDPNRKPKKENIYRVIPDYFMTADEIIECGTNDVLKLLSYLPYIRIVYKGYDTNILTFLPDYTGSSNISSINKRSHGSNWGKAQIAVNNIMFHDDVSHPVDVVSMIRVDEIAEIHLILNQSKISSVQINEAMAAGENVQPGGVINAQITQDDNKSSSAPRIYEHTTKVEDFFSPDEFSIGGIINIITKDRQFRDHRQRFHFKSLVPLGYAAPVEFYSPKYDTEMALKNANPDMRSTIYWKPDIILNEDDKASVQFYTADTKTTYSVVTEGICFNGTLIYKREKAIIKVQP